MEENRIETIARGICVKNGKVLLCRGKKAGNLYFPGGHIEFGETGAYALEREVMEELGMESRAVAFLGCCEHRFIQEGSGDHAEINLVYELDIPAADPMAGADAKEDWIDFEWMDAGDLAESAVEPAVLRQVALEWLAHSEDAAGRIVSTPSLARS